MKISLSPLLLFLSLSVSLSLSPFFGGGWGGVPVRAGLLVDSESVLVPMQCAII